MSQDAELAVGYYLSAAATPVSPAQGEGGRFPGKHYARYCDFLRGDWAETACVMNEPLLRKGN